MKRADQQRHDDLQTRDLDSDEDFQYVSAGKAVDDGRSTRDDRLNVRVAKGSAPSSRPHHACGWRDDSAKDITQVLAGKVVSSPPKSPCSTALPADEDFLVRTSASASPSPRDLTRLGVLDPCDTAEASVKELRRLRWSLDEFTFIERLGAGRVSSVGPECGFSHILSQAELIDEKWVTNRASSSGLSFRTFTALSFLLIRKTPNTS